MRVLLAALLVGLCTWATAARLPVWRSDEAFWRAAVSVDPTPRALLNLAVARGTAHRSDALAWTQRAIDRAEARGDVVVSRRARGYLRWLSVDSPD